MKIVVLMKQVPDTWSERRLDTSTGRVDHTAGDLVIDEISERALEAALTVKDSDKSTTVTLLSMGPASALDALRKGLSMGADDAVHVVDDALKGADLAVTASTIAFALRGREWDLILAGNESTDGRGGLLPAMVAEYLGVACLNAVDILEVGVQSVRGNRSADGVDDVLEAALPAVVSITERMPDARFPNFRGILGAKKKPVVTLGASDLALVQTAAWTSVVAAAERPARQAGTRIVDDGNAAAVLADYLAAQRFI